MSLIRFDDVWFRYTEEPVLRGLTLSVQSGEVVAVLGRNGAGKTTLTKLVVALLHPHRGSVSVDGVSTRGRGPEDFASRAAYLFQDTDQQLFARTVLEEVAFAPRRLGASRAESHERARAALGKLGLEHREDVHPYDLPPPERRFVALAAAIAQGAPVLVLDEPTRGLHALDAQKVGAVLRACARSGATVVAVTHDLQFVAEYCERAIVLAGGIVAADLPASVAAGDPDWASSLGLRTPPAAALSRALDLPGRPVRKDEVVAALVQRRRGEPGTPATGA